MQVLRIKFKDGDIVHLMPEEKLPDSWNAIIASKERVSLSVAQADSKSTKKKSFR